MNATNIQPRPRTTLVSVFGWVMLVLGIIMALVGILNLVIFSLVSQSDDAELVSREDMVDLPAIIPWVVENINLILAGLIVSSLLMAVAGFGVVKRQNWGRQLSILLLAVSIVWAFAGGGMGMMGQGDSPESGSVLLGPIVVAMNIGLALLTAALHGWLIWKLRSPEIRGEFVESPAESI